MTRHIFLKKTDLFHDSLPKIFTAIGLPVLISCVLSLFTALFNNKIISIYVGEYFQVSAIVSSLLGLIGNFSISVVSACWTIYSASFVNRDENSEKNLITSLATILCCQIFLTAIFLLLTDVLLAFLNTPEAVYRQVKSYYVLYLVSSLFTTFGVLYVRLITGLDSVVTALFINLINICVPSMTTYLSVAVLKSGLIGLAINGGVNGLIVAIVSAILLRKHGCFLPVKKGDFRLNFRECLRTVKVAAIIFLQDVFCAVGYFLVASQTNKYLPLDYISVLSVALPLTSVLNVFSTMIAVIVPANYKVGNYERVKKILRILFFCCVFYGVFCCFINVVLGKYYYGTLFSEAKIIEKGAKYWAFQGAGFIFMSVLSSLRFFFVATLRTKTALFSGFFELAGNAFCAYFLIPVYGEIGRSLANPIGWALAAIYLIAAYALWRKKLYPKQPTG